MSNEWARFPDDILWRRSKLGLTMPPADREALAAFMATAAEHRSPCVAPSSRLSSLPCSACCSGLSFRYFLDQSDWKQGGELSAKRPPRHGRRAGRLGHPPLFCVAAERMDQQMAAADGSGGAFRGHGRVVASAVLGPGGRCFIGTGSKRTGWLTSFPDRGGRVLRDPAYRDGFRTDAAGRQPRAFQCRARAISQPGAGRARLDVSRSRRLDLAGRGDGRIARAKSSHPLFLRHR